MYQYISKPLQNILHDVIYYANTSERDARLGATSELASTGVRHRQQMCSFMIHYNNLYINV